MTTLLAKRIVYATLTGATLLLSSFGAIAASQRAIDVLTSRGTPQAGSLPQQAMAQSGVSGVLNPAALASPGLRITLADGTTLEARLQRTASDSKKGTQSWIGTFDDAPGSVLVLSKAKGVVTGFANYKDQIFEIAPTAGGKHMMYAVDEARLPKGEVLHAPKLPADTGGTTVADLGAATTDAATSVVQDVLVLYTAASANRYGAATLESKIQSAIQAANQAYLNSQVGITLNLVGLKQSAITEQSNMDSTVNVLQADSATATLRNQLGADMVMLVSENSDYCGLSNLMTSNSTSFAPYAFGVVQSSCLSSQSLAHEFGHQQGMMHDRTSSSGWAGVYPYSYGYRRCVSDGTGFRDIMSYSCTGAPRVLQFSNPAVNYNGYATGISYELDPANSAENARSLNNTAATVAAFRGVTSTSAAPAAPSGLAVKSSAYDSVALAWVDNATNESGFKLQRSSNGVDYTVIASLGADAKAYTDSSVSTKATYYYRVAAYNSAGTSAYSNSTSVTTPDAPPPAPAAPTTIAAADNGDGTARVSWSVGSSGATSFEVMRATYNRRKGTWGTPVAAATVPSSVLSLVDSTGAGTFRYTVRAVSAGGSSAYAGPASVTVTQPTTTSSKRRRK
jgi:peptidyl-Asp metalloendopeptidase